jgi:choline dehydrogenase-like flavoprotein
LHSTPNQANQWHLSILLAEFTLNNKNWCPIRPNSIMFASASELPDGTRINADLCIVGAGAAGITLAREFIGTRVRVALLEGGGLNYDEKSQELYEGGSIGRSYDVGTSRLRYFGGSTNHWTGWCRPLDDIDFEAREAVPESGWPFKRSVLDPFYERAQAVCQLGPYNYETSYWEQVGGLGRLMLDPAQIVTRILQLTPPTRFGEVDGPELKAAKNITIFLNANALELETDSSGSIVQRVVLGTVDDHRVVATARYFVLAAGGLENPRLLLNSNSRQISGLGNDYDLVGRYFMDHPFIDVGRLLFTDLDIVPEVYLYPELETNRLGRPTDEPLQVLGLLCPPPEALYREKLVNITAQLLPKSREVLQREAVRSAKALVRQLLRFEEPDRLRMHLRGALRALEGIATGAWRGRPEGGRNRWARADTGIYEVRTVVEPVPNRSSRLVLIPEIDRFGKRRIALDWRWSANEERTLRRFHEILAHAVGAAGLGRMRIELDQDLDGIGSPVYRSAHHIGTTRMHRDRKHGVTNANCRVHGITNLYITGSSVFPTAGLWNPTLTIVALALRLADHLKDRFT